MQATNDNGVPVVIMLQPFGFAQDKRLPYTNMKDDLAKKLVVFGKLQIIFGALTIMFAAVSMGLYNAYRVFGYSYFGYGVWISIWFIATGPFGIIGGRRRSRVHVITYNILSIISASFAALLLSLAILSDVSYGRHLEHRLVESAARAGIAMESFIAGIALAEGFVAIWSSVVCCQIGACCYDCEGECCCPPSTNNPQFPTATQSSGGQPGVTQQSYTICNGCAQRQPVITDNYHQSAYVSMVSDKQPILNQEDEAQTDPDGSNCELPS